MKSQKLWFIIIVALCFGYSGSSYQNVDSSNIENYTPEQHGTNVQMGDLYFKLTPLMYGLYNIQSGIVTSCIINDSTSFEWKDRYNNDIILSIYSDGDFFGRRYDSWDGKTVANYFGASFDDDTDDSGVDSLFGVTHGNNDDSSDIIVDLNVDDISKYIPDGCKLYETSKAYYSVSNYTMANEGSDVPSGCVKKVVVLPKMNEKNICTDNKQVSWKGFTAEIKKITNVDSRRTMNESMTYDFYIPGEINRAVVKEIQKKYGVNIVQDE